MSLMERTIGSGGYWVVAGLVSLCLCSCGDSSDDPESTATSVEAATTTEPVTTSLSTTTLARTTSTRAVPAPSTTERLTTSVSTTTLGSATTTTATPSTSAAPQFPAARASLEHAGPAWAVILAGAPDFDDPVLVQAVSSAEVGGYTTSWTDCDFGAGEALGFPADEVVYTVSVYFETESDADLALAAFRAHGIDGVVAEVTTYCLD